MFFFSSRRRHTRYWRDWSSDVCSSDLVGDRFTVNRLVGEAGDTVTLPALLLVDGDTVTSDAQALAGVTVTGEIVGHGKGPKIRIHKFKNKTGYHKRQGHRQPLTDVRITGIESADSTKG